MNRGQRVALAGWRRGLVAAAAGLGLAAAAGCATNMPAGSQAGAAARVDPWQSFNRPVYAFNDTVDRAVVKPVAQFYVNHVNDGVRGMVTNFFDNLRDPWTSVNQLLQGKPVLALNDATRFVVNTIFGFGGVANVASEIGLEKHREDFGQTLGKWGAGPGPYVVLPLLGPSDVRDTVGLGPDLYFDTLRLINDSTVEWSLWGVRLIDLRASLLPAERLLEGAALDKYSLIRDGYLARRRNQVYDGDPPDEPDAPDASDNPPPSTAPGLPGAGNTK